MNGKTQQKARTELEWECVNEFCNGSWKGKVPEEATRAAEIGISDTMGGWSGETERQGGPF